MISCPNEHHSNIKGWLHVIVDLLLLLFRKLGFKYAENERENIDMFLKRQGGVVRLYFSIIVSQMKNKYRTHPLHLNEAWRWLAMFTSQGTDILSIISLQLLCSCFLTRLG